MTADPRKFGQVALVVGGDSGEREVSLRGGQAVAQAMDRLGIDYSLVGGRGGGAGQVQGALRTDGVSVIGSGVLASARSMNRRQSKRGFRAGGSPPLDGGVAGAAADAERIMQKLALPFFGNLVTE